MLDSIMFVDADAEPHTHCVCLLRHQPTNQPTNPQISLSRTHAPTHARTPTDERVTQKFDGRNPNDGCMVPSPDWVCKDLDVAYADPVIILKGNIYSGHILSYNQRYTPVYDFLFGPRSLDNNPYASMFNWFLRYVTGAVGVLESRRAGGWALAIRCLFCCCGWWRAHRVGDGATDSLTDR